MPESATGQTALGLARIGGSTRERPPFLRGMPVRPERPNEMMKLGAFFHPTGNHVAAWLHPLSRPNLEQLVPLTDLDTGVITPEQKVSF